MKKLMLLATFIMLSPIANANTQHSLFQAVVWYDNYGRPHYNRNDYYPRPYYVAPPPPPPVYYTPPYYQPYVEQRSYSNEEWRRRRYWLCRRYGDCY